MESKLFGVPMKNDGFQAYMGRTLLEESLILHLEWLHYGKQMQGFPSENEGFQMCSAHFWKIRRNGLQYGEANTDYFNRKGWISGVYGAHMCVGFAEITPRNYA